MVTLAAPRGCVSGPEGDSETVKMVIFMSWSLYHNKSIHKYLSSKY